MTIEWAVCMLNLGSLYAQFGLGKDTIPLFKFPQDAEMAEAWFKEAPVGAEFIDITSGWVRKKVYRKPQKPRRARKKVKLKSASKRTAKKRSKSR